MISGTHAEPATVGLGTRDYFNLHGLNDLWGGPTARVEGVLEYAVAPAFGQHFS